MAMVRAGSEAIEMSTPAIPFPIGATKIDEAEAIMASLPRVDSPVEHGFFGGFYLRQITMPGQQIVASQIHKTRHPFVVTKGRVTVYNEANEVVQEITAPYVGITEPGTRRLLLVHEETVWTTFHFVNGETDMQKIADIVIEPHVNPILGVPHAMIQHLSPEHFQQLTEKGGE